MINVNGFKYEKSTGAYLKQGIKNNRTPYGAVGGGNGSFIMPGNPPKAIFTVEENEKESNIDFYATVKRNSGRRVTEKYCRDIYEKVCDKSYETLDELNTEIISNCE